MGRAAQVYLATTALLFVGAAGCKKAAKSPDEAFQKLEAAVAAGDGAAFYDLLTQPTHASIEAVWKDERLQRTIITGKFPEAEAGSALAKLAAAEADDPRAFFVRVAKERKTVESFRKRLGSVSGPIQHKPDGESAIWVARADGMPFHFARSDGGWAFAELEGEWALERDRQSHAVKTVRDNAALYQKAGN
jgi:hypothetical protein